MEKQMKAEKEQKCNARRIKGITLIALVITIVVLLILAAVSITAVFGDNGLLQMAKEAGKKTNLSTLEELANTKYLNKQTNSWINGTSADITMQEVVAELEKAGYDIITDTQGKEVSEITLTPDTITMEINSTEEIKVAYKLTEGTNKYYAKVDGKYYEMTMGSSGITVSREESKINEGAVTEPTITAESKATEIVTVEVSEKIVTVTSKDQGGNATITVTCEGKTKDCEVTVNTPGQKVVTEPLANLQTAIQNKKLHTDTTMYVDESNNPVITIPEGFTIVPNGTNSVEYSETPKVDDGIVITDKMDEEGNVIGNEFVWVPVENPTEMYGIISEDEDGTKNYAGKLYNFSSSGDATKNNWQNVTNDDGTNKTEVVDGITVDWIKWTSTTGYREPDTVSYDASNFDSVKENEYSDFKTQLQKEFNDLVDSVNKYKGFYIGRYETSGLTVTETPIVQAGPRPTVRTNWYTMYKNSKKIASQNSVTSRMIWGCQWDQVMIWMKDVNNINDISKKYINDSTDMGNYSETPTTTGSNEDYAVKNIYDMAGNVWEWTIEARSTDIRVNRGGGYYYSGSNNPASDRNITGYGPDYGTSINIGSRATLYVNL